MRTATAYALATLYLVGADVAVIVSVQAVAGIVEWLA